MLNYLIQLLSKLADLRRHFDGRFDKIETDGGIIQSALQDRTAEVLVAIAGVRTALVVLGEVLKAIQDLLTGAAMRLVFTVFYQDQLFQGVTSMVITDSQKFTASIQPVDARGNPALVDGVPVWTASNPEVLSVSISPDGMSADVAAVGPLGSGQVSVEADADLGEGVRAITGVLDVEVKAGEAVKLVVNTAPPVEQ
jgi:hypothetical protein